MAEPVVSLVGEASSIAAAGSLPLLSSVCLTFGNAFIVQWVSIVIHAVLLGRT